MALDSGFIKLFKTFFRLFYDFFFYHISSEEIYIIISIITLKEFSIIMSLIVYA